MKKELRDTIIAFSGILVSLSAGVWTLFNYNVNQEDAELDTIYIISSEISSLELNFKEDKKKYKETLNKLITDVQYRYLRIKKPFWVTKSAWDDQWIQLSKSLKKAFAQSSYEAHLKEITKIWDSILEKKKITNLNSKRE